MIGDGAGSALFVLAIAFGKVDDERNSGARVVKPAFGARESDAVVGPEKDDGVFGEAVFLELGKKVFRCCEFETL